MQARIQDWWELGPSLFDASGAEAIDLTRLLAEERNRLNQRSDLLRSRLTQSRAIGLAAGAAMVLGAGWLLIRWVARPLHQLGSAVEAVAGGDLYQPIPAPGPPNLAELGRRVEAMRQRILEELDDASRAREALARRGMVVLTLRDELVSDGAQLPEGVLLGAGCVPAEGVVAGDWYDFVRVADHRLAVALVDVSGHGAESAVFALKTKQLLLSSLRAGHEPAQSLSWLADQLQDTDERFLTGVVLVVDVLAGTLTYASAGHPPLLLTSSDGHSQRLDPTGPLLGPLEGSWGQRTLPLAPGDRVTAYSDGMIEALDERGEELGIHGLEELVAQSRHLEGRHLVERCLAEVRRRTNHRHDDLTMVVVGLGRDESAPVLAGSSDPG